MNIDKLAIAIQKDFDKVNERFDKVDERFAKVDEEFGKVHAEIAEIKVTMSGMATKEELKSFKDEILAAIAGVRKVADGIDARFSAYAVRTNEDISRLQSADKNIDVRLRVVERRG
jgi:archaellum component FlaC